MRGAARKKFASSSWNFSAAECGRKVVVRLPAFSRRVGFSVGVGGEFPRSAFAGGPDCLGYDAREYSKARF
jgi:hypothetical protein